jgi:hypothetical protein
MCPAIFSTLDWIVHFLVLPFSLSAYASVVVSRLYRFYDSKRDAWETIISMEDKLSRVDCPTLSHPWASACLNHPTQQLRYAGLLRADQAVDAIHTAIEQSLQGAQKKVAAGETNVEIPRSEWEKRIVSIRPSLCAIFQPWPLAF